MNTSERSPTLYAPTESLLPQSHEARDRRKKRVRRPLATLALIGFVTPVIVTNLLNISNEARVGGDMSNETPNPDIGSVQIFDGATVRSDPYKGDGFDSNRLDDVDSGTDEATTIFTPKGVRISVDNNGTWYGIPAEDLTAALPTVNATDDRDGIVWVNEQRAKPSLDRDTSNE